MGVLSTSQNPNIMHSTALFYLLLGVILVTLSDGAPSPESNHIKVAAPLNDRQSGQGGNLGGLLSAIIGTALQPQGQYGNPPMVIPTKVVILMDTPTKVVILMDTPTKAVIPMDTPAKVVMPIDTPTKVVIPMDTLTKVVIPMD